MLFTTINGSPFSPTNIGIDRWFNAFSLSGDFSRPANGASVSSAYDLGKQAENVTQITPATQPTFVSNAINGAPSLAFNGSQYLSAANSSKNNYAGECAVFALVKLSDATVARRFLSHGSTGGISVGNRQSPNLLKYDLTCNNVLDVFTATDYWVVGSYQVYAAILKNNAGSWSVDFYRNGVFLENIATSAPVSSSSSYYIGARSEEHTSE